MDVSIRGWANGSGLGSLNVAFSCPRCARDVDEELYGPCSACRAELRASMGREGRAMEAEAYEPKMHVTPNAVALKDD